MSRILLIAGALYHFAFALYHVKFWNIFQWNTNLKKSGEVNRGITQVLNLCMIYVFIIVGIISLIFPNDLCLMRLGHFILGAVSLFWFIRALEQVIFFKLSHKLSRLLFFLFIIGGMLYLLPLF
ncbi:hypothetical protein JXB12_03510 [candidate division KSB1 bacterium]|nr:hypothetical protein [candidate division KSB1 bacterium]